MTPLRKKMIDVMVLKGYSPSTQSTYLYSVEKVARYFHRSPDTIDPGELEQYFLYLLIEKNMASASVRLVVNSMRFLNTHVLQRPAQDFVVRYPKRAQRIPELLTRDEVQRILAQVSNPKHYTLLATCYALGLRVSEVVHLQVRDIDSARELVHVRAGKGNKDRTVILPDSLLKLLRQYWLRYHPRDILFYGQEPTVAITTGSVGKVFRRARSAAGIDKRGGVHSLRHAYATHQLEAGMPAFKLQRLLGHVDMKSTLRYVHWLPTYENRGRIGVDLLCWPEEISA